MGNTRFMRTTALLCAIGSLLSVVLGISDSIFPDLLRPPGNWMPWHIAAITMHTLMLAGMVGLALSDALGHSLVGRIALGAAVVGQASFVVAELAGTVGAKGMGQMIYAIGGLLVTLGMLATGVVVLLVKRWQGWHSWTPLVWELYPLIALLVAVTMGQPAASLAIGLWGICSLLVSVALWQEAGQHHAVQPRFAS